MRQSSGARSTSRLARERVVALIYEAEAKGVPLEDLVDRQILPLESLESELTLGLSRRIEDVDALLGDAAEGWAVERMNAVDRAILRLGVYELAHRDVVPTAVILNEAVELAQTYSTSRSGAFVNGVLSAVAGRLRGGGPDEAEEDDDADETEEVADGQG